MYPDYTLLSHFPMLDHLDRHSRILLPLALTQHPFHRTAALAIH